MNDRQKSFMYNRDVTNPPFGGRFHFVRVSHDSSHKYCAMKNKIIREISHEL